MGDQIHCSGPILEHIKLLIKRWSTWHNANGDRSVFLFSTPRSGSTWLAETVVTQRGFKFVNEPFNIRVPHVRDNLGMNTWEEFYEPTAGPRIESYVKSFLDGQDRDARFKRPTPFSEFWRPRTSRILFKVLFAGEHNINWFREKFNADIIYLVRHPIPVSQSRTELPRLLTFLNSSFAANFTEAQLRFAHRVFENGDFFQHAVLDWCFQNAIPLRNLDESWLVISYEQMVLEFPTIVEHLVAKFDFERPDKMLARAFRASQSTNLSSKQSKAVLEDEERLAKSRRWLIEKWTDKVGSTELENAGEILDAFGIDYYDASEPMPNERYWLRTKSVRI